MTEVTPEALEVCTLDECPPGLFMFNGIMGFKSEYTTTLDNPRRYQCDAYVVESGEYFHGGAKNTQERAALVVTPLRTGQLIPAPRVDDAMVERRAIFRQIGRWEMAYEIAFNLETPVKDCTPGAPEQAAFDKAAKLVSRSVSALAGREFCKLPVHVQFHDGEWASIMDEATAAISAMQVKP